MGIEVSQRALRAADVKRSGGAPKVEWLGQAALPAGLLLDSITEPNITDMRAFAEALKGLIGGGARGKRLCVALPDYASRVSILDFENMPGKNEETERMLRWRLKKVLPFEVDEAALKYQYLGKFTSEDKTQHRFLASIIKYDILAQYEEALSLSGLKPAIMEISSFAVWNLFHDHVLREAGSSANFALMNLSGGKLTMIVFQKSVPHFLRLKDMGKYDAETAGPAADGADVTRVLRELTASLTFYRENYADTDVGKVFISGDVVNLKNIAEEVCANSAMKAQVLDLDKAVSISAAQASGAAGVIAYSAACGAALEF